MKIHLNPTSKTLIIVGLLLCIVSLQMGFDATKITLPADTPSGISPEFVRLADMGLHGAVGSFLWVNAMPQLIDLFFNPDHREYLDSLKFLVNVDAKFGYPYAFSVLTIPAIRNLPNRTGIALGIGQYGIDHADPDWRISYYMGADYFLDLKDGVSAARYYDIAARTPGIPTYAKSFALNFSAMRSIRQQTEELWQSIHDTATDEFTRERAQAYIDRLKIFDYLEAAARAYKSRFGAYPTNLDQLVAKGVISELPQDPFGFTFKIQEDGTVGIVSQN